MIEFIICGFATIGIAFTLAATYLALADGPWMPWNICRKLLEDERRIIFLDNRVENIRDAFLKLRRTK